MAKDVKINGIAPEYFGAHLLDYSIGPCDYKNGYFLPPRRMVPAKLTPKIGLRPISLTFDFEGNDRNEISRCISKLTAKLQKEARLVLPDGYNYWCELDSISTPKEKAPWIQQVKFSFSGFRHGPLDEIQFSSDCSVFIAGNCETPAIVKITPAVNAETVVFNGITVENVSGPIVIDGIYTTIKDEDGNNIFADTDITEWPKLKPGENAMTIDGIALVELSYYPIYL